MHTSFLVHIPFEWVKEMISIFKFTIHFITYIHALQDINFNFTKCSENHQRCCQWCLSCHHVHLCFVALLIQPVAHIISILKLVFICFTSYCLVCRTTTPKGSSSGGHHPGSCSCHSGSSTAYSVGQGSHGCSSGGNWSSLHDSSGCSLIRGTRRIPLRLTSTISTSNLQTPLTLNVLPNGNRYAVDSCGFLPITAI